MTTQEWLDLERTNLVNMRHHAQYVQDRAITMHNHAEQYPEVRNKYGIDVTKPYTQAALSQINQAIASVLSWIDYIELLHRTFQEEESDDHA